MINSGAGNKVNIRVTLVDSALHHHVMPKLCLGIFRHCVITAKLPLYVHVPVYYASSCMCKRRRLEKGSV